MAIDAHRQTHETGTDRIKVWRLDGIVQEVGDPGSPQQVPTEQAIRAAITAGGGSPSAHATSHENGGTDEIDVTGLSGVLADPQTPAAHAASHSDGGSDEVSAADLAGIVTTVGSPGSDSNVPTEQAVREAITGFAGTGADHAFYTYLAAHLEPLAIEAPQIGTFTYAISGSVTKLLLNAWQTRFSSTGRWEMRDPTQIMPLRGVSLIGTGAASLACVIDPSLPTYTEARTTYYDRLNTLATTTPKYLALTAPSTVYPFLPGPYGTIVVGVTIYDFTWIIISLDGGASIGMNVANEIGDASGDYQRVTNNAPFPVSRYIGGSVLTGVERSAGVGKGGILYVICDSSWGEVTDSTSYIFRDDFMGATLDTGSTWTRSQSTAGNIEIATDWAWCKVKGNSSWGANGAFSQATTSRSAGKIFECYVWTGDGVGAGGAGLAPNLVVGWHDGAGQSYADFAHGIDFSETGGVRAIFIFEDSNSRGTVGASYSLNTIYRVRITLGTSSATYEIQGGTQYAAMGGASWTDITPGTTSSTTTPLAVGFTINDPVTTYVGDVKAY